MKSSAQSRADNVMDRLLWCAAYARKGDNRLFFAKKRRLSPLIQPQQRLTDEKVADDFVDVRVGGQRGPEIDVVRMLQRDPGEEEAGLTHRPVAVVHHV